VDKKPVSGLNENLPALINLNIDEMTFALFFHQSEQDKTTYKILDYFRTELRCVYEGINGEILESSQFAIYLADDLIRINNLRSEVLLPSFRAYRYME
jgi:hypothetical protein